MPRLPQPGSDSGQWGNILNDYLSVSHNIDGSLKNNVVKAGSLQTGAGVNGQVLVYDSTVAGGFRWETVAGGGGPSLGGDLSGTTSNAQIVPSAVGTTELSDTSVTAAKLANGSVATLTLQDNAITTAKIADGQVTEAKLSSAVQTKLNTPPSSTPADGSLTPIKLNADTPTNGEILSYNAGAFEWIVVPSGGGGGEVNTASNVGSVGVGVYKQKTGVNLEFKNIAATSNKITITNNTSNDTVGIDVSTANLGITKTDVGLANVDNTSDASKPLSTAVQTALSGKSDTSHTHTLDNLSDVSTSGATDGQSLVYQSGNWGAATVSSGGVTDHGALTGLADDDHTQYHNDARGDARYYTQSQVDTALSGKANTSHAHLIADITNLQTTLDGKASTTTTFTGANSITGGGDLSANRTFSLVGDSASPGNSQYYGTNGSGSKGYYALPVADPVVGGDLSGTVSNAQIIANAVGTAEIADTSVTLAKLSSGVQTVLAASIAEVVLDKQWLIAGPVTVASGDVDYILPVYVSVPTGHTAQVTGARARINSGTNAVISFMKNGTTYTGVANMTVTTAGVSQTGLTAALANGDLLSVVVNSTSGAPMNMTVQLTYRIVR